MGKRLGMRNIFFLIAVIHLGSPLFAQPKLKVIPQGKKNFSNVIYSNYRSLVFSSMDPKFQYSLEKKKDFALMRSTESDSVLQKVPLSAKETVWVKDFLVKDSIAYYLYYDGIYTYPLSMKTINYEDRQEKALNYIPLNKLYDQIYCFNDTLVVTTAYNTYGAPYCAYTTIALNSFEEVMSQVVYIDAIGFSHLPSYFVSVSSQNIAITNCLKNSISIYNFKDPNPQYSLGNGQLLNPSIDSIPFETDVTKTPNVRKMVSEVSTFGYKINRFEGVFFMNDSLLVSVEKVKKSDDRILHFYSLELKENKWYYTGARKMKSGLRQFEKYGVISFSSSPQFICRNNKIHCIEIDLPSSVNSLSQGRRYINQLSTNELQNHPMSLYCYEILF